MFAFVPTQPPCWATAVNTEARSVYGRPAWRRRGWLASEYKQALDARIGAPWLTRAPL